jgi:hypothetical protein
MKKSYAILIMLVCFLSFRAALAQNPLPAQLEKQKAKNDSSRMADKADARLIDLKQVTEQPAASLRSDSAATRSKKPKKTKRKKG